MKQNDVLNIKCDYISGDFKGVAKMNGMIIYTPFLLPGEEAQVEITNVKGTTAHAKIIKLLTKSPERKNSKCGSYMACGSCQALHLDYKKQLEYKKEFLRKLYKDNNLNIRVNDVTGMDNPYNYRNKVIASFSMKKGKIIYGMYEESSHNVIFNPDCLIQNETLNKILKSIQSNMEALKIKPEGFGGVIRHVLLRIGVRTNEVLLVFVVNNEMFPGRGELIKRIVSENPEVKTIIQNTNPRNTSVVLGEKERILYGPGFIYDILLGNRYKIGPRSFYQVNPIETEKLYAKAIELADVTKEDTLMDAYSGIGTISLSIAKSVKKVIGVEIVKEAVENAIDNAKTNGIHNARFYCNDVKEYMRTFDEKTDILIVDPPRSGCDDSFLNAVKKLKPKKIVYISCNPETQARDCFKLSLNYKIGEAYPFDMFPNTQHVETIVGLYSKNNK